MAEWDSGCYVNTMKLLMHLLNSNLLFFSRDYKLLKPVAASDCTYA